MNFGEILDEWEKRRRGKKRARKENAPERDPGMDPEKEKRAKSPNPPTKGGIRPKTEFEKLLDRYPVQDKDAAAAREPVPPMIRRTQFRRMKPERIIDLHGNTLEEALVELERFIRACLLQKVRKILVIHGKGHHSGGEPILRKGIREYLAQSPDIGETGVPPREQGGDGATWAILRYRSR